jgi:hypothetical protein
MPRNATGVAASWTACTLATAEKAAHEPASLSGSMPVVE